VQVFDPKLRLGLSHESRAAIILTWTNTLNVCVLFGVMQIDVVQLAALNAWLSSVITLAGYVLAKSENGHQTPPTTDDDNYESQD